MPYSIAHNSDGSVRVVNAITGKVYARRTTEKKAHIQIAIMEKADKRKWFRRQS
jgi:virulence-associated protein VapD